MKSTKQVRETRLNELVETHNLALALNRLNDATPYDSGRWRRALYHALCMRGMGSPEVRKKIREALELP